MRLFTAAAVPFVCVLAMSVATSRDVTAQTQDHTYTSADIEAGDGANIELTFELARAARSRWLNGR